MRKIAAKRIVAKFSAVALTTAALLADLPLQANDGMFPSATAAKAAIDYDGQGFIIQGDRTFVASGSLHYPRVPRAQWGERMLQMKRAGLNTVQTYVFWNEHEAVEGKFDFTGNRDLDAFLKLVKSMGMYATVRVSPLYLRGVGQRRLPGLVAFQAGIAGWEDEPQFLAAVDRYLDQVLPIVAANQIHRGGSVIMVQLENEHPNGWGTEMPNGYFRHLREKAIAGGIEVPYFFSGLHHSADPAGNRPWDSATRTNPWYSTEFWPGWFDRYGAMTARYLRNYDRGTWKILAYGGNGYNYYMFHGGANFDYFNNAEVASSYDYTGAIGQAGDLRPVYYRFKRAAWFGQTFSPILETSRNVTEEFRNAATNPAVRVTARRSPNGTLIFLDNPGNSDLETRVNGLADGVLPAAGPLKLRAGEIMAVARDFTLAPGVTLVWAPVRILGAARQGDTTTLVIYGQPGTPAELQLTVTGGKAVVRKGGDNFKSDGAAHAKLSTLFPAEGQAEYVLGIGSKRIRILAVSDSLADRTWFVEASGSQFVVCGPEYVGDAAVVNGKLQIKIERPWKSVAAGQAVAYGPVETPIPLGTLAATTEPALKLPTLNGWQSLDAAEAASPAFKDDAWLASEEPQQMGADGDNTAYAWYRTRLHADQNGQYTLAVGSAADRAELFLDGERVKIPTVRRAKQFPLTLTAGGHTLAIFAAHDGRNKLTRLGAIEKFDAKGIVGPVMLSRGKANGGAIKNWQVLPVQSRPDETPPAADASGWKNAHIGEDVFDNRRGYAWYQATVPALQGAESWILSFDTVDDNATVFWNGHQIGRHNGFDEPFEFRVASMPAGGTNLLSVLVENTGGGGGITGGVSIGADDSSRISVKGWKMRGGPGDPQATSGWQAVGPDLPAGQPHFFRTTFSSAPPGESGPRPVVRVSLKGMSSGFVWLNGHNLGHYPEKVPVDGIHLPECWLNQRANSLIIFDDEGNRPDGVSLRFETEASRVAKQIQGTVKSR
jgi:beta-galactosidase